MLFDMTLKEGFARIGLQKLIYDKRIIPGRCPDITNSPYRPGYEWLFYYERKIARVLKPWMDHLRYELIGTKGVICEALSNAFAHGNNKDYYTQIHVSVYLGESGIITRIINGGDGFDFRTKVKELKRGKRYFVIAGNGLKMMMESVNYTIFFTDKGKAFNLLYLFQKKI